MMLRTWRARLTGLFAAPLELERRMMHAKSLAQMPLDLLLDFGPAQQMVVIDNYVRLERAVVFV
jgi:hypothetical protein